jgi:hypothetical protein
MVKPLPVGHWRFKLCNIMKHTKSIVALSLIAVSSASFAFGDTTLNSPTAVAGAVAGAGAISGSSATANPVSDSKSSAGASATQNQTQTSTATSNSGGNTTTSTSNSGGNTQTNAGNNASQSTNVNVEAEKTWRTAASATAAALTSANGTCMGSSSVGAQGTFGLSFGTTWTDASCDIRYDAQALAAMGMKAAATARLCQKAEIAAAMEQAGTPCPTKAEVKVAQTAAAAPKSVAGYTGNDPIVLKRLGYTN